MSVLKLGNPIKIGSLAADPASPENGLIYYNTTVNAFKQYINGAWEQIPTQTAINSVIASNVAYQRLDANKKNIQATSDDVELALTDLDDAIGALSTFTPGNYSPNNISIIKDHFVAIDAVLGNHSNDAVNISYAPTNLANWSGSADPGNVDGALDQLALRVKTNEGSISTNSAHVAGDGTDHAAVANLVTLSGVAANSTDLGTFTGTVIPDAQTIKAALQSLETYAENSRSIINNFEWYQSSAISVIADNTLTPPTEVLGDVYVLSASGGVPNAAYDGASAGDIVKFDGTLWVATTPTVGMFISVDNESNSLRHWDGSAWSQKYFEATTASNGLTKVGFDIQVATGGITNAMLAAGIDAAKIADGSVSNTEFQYISTLTSNAQTQLDSKLANVVEDTTPQLGGDLDVNGKAIEGAASDLVLAGQNSVKRAKQASKASFIEEEYIHAIALSGAQTDIVIADLTFAHATVDGLEITYKIVEATSGDIRIGTLRVVSDGTSVAINDMFTETADVGITFSAVVNGANVNVRYSSGANAATMRADVKKFLA